MPWAILFVLSKQREQRRRRITVINKHERDMIYVTHRRVSQRPCACLHWQICPLCSKLAAFKIDISTDNQIHNCIHEFAH